MKKKKNEHLIRNAQSDPNHPYVQMSICRSISIASTKANKIINKKNPSQLTHTHTH